MKKSKIIIPALGMLLLSTAASVTGTVAWFTSMQTGQAEITSFAVTKTGGTLTVSMGAGVGTVLSGSTITLGTNVKLTHGSFDHTQDAIWKPNDALDTFTKVTRASAEATDSAYQWSVDGSASQAGTLFYAVSWTITLSYEFQADARNVYVFFDGTPSATATDSSVAGSYFTHSKADSNDTGTYEKFTYMGFRLAMLNTSTNGGNTAGPKLIWAPGQSAVADEKYQNGATATSQGVYASSGTATVPNTYVSTGSLLDANFPATVGAFNFRSGDVPANPTQQPNYIGTFVKPASGASTILLNCVAWFEGNDSNVVDAAELDQVSASMKFYTRVAPSA